MLKSAHQFQTDEVRVFVDAIPIFGACGHVIGRAFGRELEAKRQTLKDSPARDVGVSVAREILATGIITPYTIRRAVERVA